MKVVRCPECGNRLDSGYCPMCMKRVPFPAQEKETAWQQMKYASTRREEDHECIRFDEVKKPPRTKPQTTNVFRTLGNAKQQRRQTQNKKQVTTVAIVVAVLSLISSLASVFDEVKTAAPEPEYNYDAYVQAEGFSVDGVSLDAPVVIYNDNNLLVTVDSAGYYYDDSAVALTIVNDSDRDVDVSTELVSANGYMFPYVSLYAPVSAGDSAQCFVQIPEHDLAMLDITQVWRIQFCLDITDSKEYDRIGYTDLITLEAEGFEGYTENVEYAGTEIYDDGTVRIILRGTELSQYDDCTLKLYIENTGDRTVCLSDRDILLNAEETSAMLWTQLLPHSRSVEEVYIYDMQERGISRLDQIKEISIDLLVEYMEDVNLEEWMAEEIVNTNITFCPGELS